jgi:hypothetical protein
VKKCLPKALTPYIDGELAPDAREQIEEHLRGCPSCGALLDEVTSARERVRGMGRAVIPNTVLMPALEAFRDRAGIGQAARLDLADIPEPAPVDTAWEAPSSPVAPVEAPLEEVATTEPAAGIVDMDDDARFEAIVSAPRDEEPATWIDVAAEPATDDVAWHNDEAEDPIAEDPIAEDPIEPLAVPEPPPWELETAPEDQATPLDARPDAPAPHQSPPWLEADAADSADMEARGRRLVEEDLAAQWALEKEIEAGWPAPEAAAEMPEPEMPVPEMPEPEMAETEMPEPEMSDPELEPAARDYDAPLETAILAPDFNEEPAAAAQAHETQGDDVAEAVARMREELDQPGPSHGRSLVTAALRADAEPTPPVAEDRRPTHTQTTPGTALQSFQTQIKIGIGAAAAILLLLGAVLVVPRLTQPKPAVTATHVQQTPGSPASPAAGASPAAAAAPAASPPPAAPAGAIPTLTGVVTGGAGGSGYRVLRVRTGTPGGGVSRIVFDLDGPGPAPDAQFGRGSDGNLYLQVAGLTMDPAMASGFAGVGPVTAMSPTGASGTSLKLATTGSPQYSMYYLSGPSRLVIDLR